MAFFVELEYFQGIVDQQGNAAAGPADQAKSLQLGQCHIAVALGRSLRLGKQCLPVVERLAVWQLASCSGTLARRSSRIALDVNCLAWGQLTLTDSSQLQ